MRDHVPFDVVQGEDDAKDGEHAGHHRDNRLHAHNEVKTHDAATHDQSTDDDERHDFCARAPAPAQAVEDRGRGEYGDDHEERLPAHAQQPGDERRKAVPSNPEGGAAKNHGRGGTSFSRNGDDATKQETHGYADQAHHDRLPKQDAKAEDVGAVAQSQHRNVGAEPGPEEFARASLALALADDVDAVSLYSKGGPASRAKYLGEFFAH